MATTTKFGEAFSFTDERVQALTRPGRDSSLETLASAGVIDEGTIKTLRDHMVQDGIMVDGRLLGIGTLSFVFNTAHQNGQGTPIEIPDAVTRIEYMHALEHPIVLQPVFKKTYGNDFVVYIVPNAPDLSEIPVTFEDVKRTMQVLLADGKIKHLWDFETDNFVFLKDNAGEIIRYPSSPDIPDDFRGKPIAFVRDFNAIPRDIELEVDETKGQKPRGEQWLQGKFNIGLKDLNPAPRECVEACKQQYARTQRLAGELKAAGIEPNVNLPGPVPTLQHVETITPAHETRIAIN